MTLKLADLSMEGLPAPCLIIDAFPPHLISLEKADEIEDFFRYPDRLTRRVLRAVRNSDGFMHFRANDPWEPDAIQAAVELAEHLRLGLMIRVPVIDKSPHKMETIASFHEAIKEFSPPNSYKIVVAESALSKDVDGVKGENETDRAAWVADAFDVAAKIYDSMVAFTLGGTELAQATEAKHGNYDPLRDWQLVASTCKDRGFTLSGILQAYSAKRMLYPPTNIIEAAKFANSVLNCEFGIIPINDETDPQSFIAARAAQTKEILQAVPTLGFLGLTTWNRKEAIPDAETYFRGCGTAIEAMRLGGKA